MENDSNLNNQDTLANQQPEFIRTEESPSSAPAAPDTAVQSPPDSSKYTSILLTVLLLLAFFSPAGAALFLPIVLVGIWSATKHAKESASLAHPGAITPAGIIFSIFKVVFIVGAVIAIGFIALIGLFFILIATGGADFRMGS